MIPGTLSRICFMKPICNPQFGNIFSMFAVTESLCILSGNLRFSSWAMSHCSTLLRESCCAHLEHRQVRCLKGAYRNLHTLEMSFERCDLLCQAAHSVLQLLHLVLPHIRVNIQEGVHKRVYKHCSSCLSNIRSRSTHSANVCSLQPDLPEGDADSRLMVCPCLLKMM